jgi:hypothetical protein
MTRIAATLLLGLATLATPAFAQTTYDLRKLSDRKAVLNESVDESEFDSEKMNNKVLNTKQPDGQQVIKEESESKGHDYHRTRTVRAVDAEGKPTEIELFYASFKDLETDQELEVMNTKVVFSKGADGKWSRKTENGKVPPALARKLDKELASLGKKGEKKKKREEVMFPEKPVAVGATWKIDAVEMAKEMGFKVEELEQDKCKGAGKLESLTTEEGKDYLTLTIAVTMTFNTFQGLPATVPLVITLDGTMKFSADGSMPNSSQKLNMTMEGTVAPPQAPEGMVVVFNMTGKKVASRKKNTR